MLDARCWMPDPPFTRWGDCGAGVPPAQMIEERRSKTESPAQPTSAFRVPGGWAIFVLRCLISDPVSLQPKGLGRTRSRTKIKRPAKAGRRRDFPAATYSSTPQGCSTIGPEELSCRVRNGIGRFLLGITTGKNSQPKPVIRKNADASSKNSNKMCGQASRPVSTG